MHTLRYRLAMLAVLGFTVAACGSSDGAGSQPGPDSDTGVDRDTGAGSDGSTSDAGSGDDVGGDSGTTPGALDDSIVILVDEQQVDIVDGVSLDTITFTVPDNAVSVGVVVDGAPETSYTLGSWIDGAGDTLVPNAWRSLDGAAPAICTVCDNRVVGSEAAFGALAPNNEDGEFAPGEHTITVLAYEIAGMMGAPEYVSSSARVTVYAKVLDAVPTSGVLDVNVHLTGAGGWTAESAENDPTLQAMLDEVRTIYAQVDLEIGEIRYIDIGEEWQVVEGIQGPAGDMSQLFALSGESDLNTVNLFFVREVLQGSFMDQFGTLLGVAGGIPGPMLIQGTNRSGVVIAIDPHDAPEITTGVGHTTAHELGHFLGLSHTTEGTAAMFGQELHDPIDDTPEDDPSYLMFSQATGSNLSEWQGRVMRLNPWTRHPEAQ